MNAVNPFLKNKYADLGAVIEALRVPFTKNGLSVSQMIGGDGGGISVTTVLLHKSGQWMESTITLPLGDEKGRSLAQSAGAIITYLRRYGLASIAGAYSDEDTDGNAPKKAVTVEVRDGNATATEVPMPEPPPEEDEGPKLAAHPFADYVLPWKKAKELTGLDKPTLQDVFNTGDLGVDYLINRRDADLPSDKSMRLRVEDAQRAIRAFLDSHPKGDDDKKIKEFQILSRAGWNPWVKTLAIETPYYAAYGGGPDTYHIIGSLKKMGYTEFTDENANELKAMLQARAEKAEEEGKGTSG